MQTKINKIFKKTKSLPLDLFLEKVLYDNDFGYYQKKNPFGKNGDFITSPKISKLFSEIIAVWIVSTWEIFGKPKKFNIVELGPGDGSLIKEGLEVFKKFPKFKRLAKEPLGKYLFNNPLISKKETYVAKYSLGNNKYLGRKCIYDLDGERFFVVEVFLFHE